MSVTLTMEPNAILGTVTKGNASRSFRVRFYPAALDRHATSLRRQVLHQTAKAARSL
jgi:hypothetical protein